MEELGGRRSTLLWEESDYFWYIWCGPIKFRSLTKNSSVSWSSKESDQTTTCFGIKFRINQISIHFEHLFHYPQKVVDNCFVTIEDALFFRANFSKTETFRPVLKTFPYVSDDSHQGKRGSSFRKTTFLLLIHCLTTSPAVLVFRQKNVKWHIEDNIEHFVIYWRYILKIYWW